MAAPTKTRVLLVDDSVDFTDMLTLLLERCGCEVASVSSGSDALEAFRQLRPQLALLDIGLPDLDGASVAEQLRAEDAGCLLVAVTGYAADTRTDMRPAPFDRRLLKPVELSTLQALIAAVRERG